jgi:hypothetical protein
VFVGGEQMGAAPAVPLGRTVAPGETADLSVTLTAPAAAGTYHGSWRLRNGQGVTFGIDNSVDGTFWVEITVAAPAPGAEERVNARAEGQATPTIDPAHSGQGTIEFVVVERGSGARLLEVAGVGRFAVIGETRIVDEHGNRVEFGSLQRGQLVFVSGEPGEGSLLAHEIRVLRRP